MISINAKLQLLAGRLVYVVMGGLYHDYCLTYYTRQLFDQLIKIAQGK